MRAKFVLCVFLSTVFSVQSKKYNIGDVTPNKQLLKSNEPPSASALEKKVFSPHSVYHCPVEPISRIPINKNKDEKPQEARLEFENGEEQVDLFWFNENNNNELFLGTLEPYEYIKVSTFINDHFIVKSSKDKSIILLDLVVGVHHIKLPEGIICHGKQGEGTYRSNPPGLLNDEATIRGWMNKSPCDITGYYIFPNGTERWMTDLPVGTIQPHFEITYLTHNFIFKLNDDRIIYNFIVGPTKIPKCSKILKNKEYVNTEVQINDNLLLSMENVSNVTHQTKTIQHHSSILLSTLEDEDENIKTISDPRNISVMNTCPILKSF